MNRREFHIGPGAASLLLIAVVLCMSVLGMLSLVSARGDVRLSERNSAMAISAALIDVSAEHSFAALDELLADCARDAANDDAYLAAAKAVLPEGMRLFGNTVSWLEESNDGRRLDCEVEIAPLGDFPRARFTAHRLYTELDEALTMNEGNAWGIWD